MFALFTERTGSAYFAKKVSSYFLFIFNRIELSLWLFESVLKTNGTYWKMITRKENYIDCVTNDMIFAVADPGFPRGGAANSPGGVPTYNFPKFSQKLHEIERIWTPGGHTSLVPPLDPPLICVDRLKPNMVLIAASLELSVAEVSGGST